jgi:hypothetical protein
VDLISTDKTKQTNKTTLLQREIDEKPLRELGESPVVQKGPE